jgi:putative hydrolase of the HAD superfamily
VTVSVVLLDALGTLVRLEPPGPPLRAELVRVAGVDVGEDAAAAAFRAEIAYYLDHHLEGRDAASLERLRDRCAEVLADSLGAVEVDAALARRAMLAALHFTPFPDAAPALRELRARGHRLVATSNWDCSLPRVLDRVGLGQLLDGVVSSAEVGSPKPAPELFRAALRLAGAAPGAAAHVGDSLANDVGGAHAAGIRPVLLVREGPRPAGVEAIRTLAELPSLI